MFLARAVPILSRVLIAGQSPLHSDATYHDIDIYSVEILFGHFP
jgi:hypothetical protein